MARIVTELLLEANDDPASLYGKGGGTRSLDNDHICMELRYINSLRPLCFMSDAEVAAVVRGRVDRLPALRKRKYAEPS